MAANVLLCWVFSNLIEFTLFNICKNIVQKYASGVLDGLTEVWNLFVYNGDKKGREPMADKDKIKELVRMLQEKVAAEDWEGVGDCASDIVLTLSESENEED